MNIFDSGNRVTFGTKITDRIWEDNNGQLICHDCIIARTGYYDYLESDVVAGGDENKIVKVFRSPEEVFNPISMASFENKPFCNDHPDEDVSPENCRYLQCGFMRNVARGKGPLDNCLICDVVVSDPDVIYLIKTGQKRELSLGYDTEIVEKDGQYYMTNIRGNHLALVDSGRAGCATIRDNAIRFNKNLGGKEMFFDKKTAKLFDDNEDIIEVEEINDEEEIVEETTDCGTMPKTDDNVEVKLSEVLAKLDEVLTLLKTKSSSDEAVEEEVKETEENETAVNPITETSEQEDVLLDADEELKEETAEEEVVEDSDEDVEEMIGRKTDSDNVYSKFATNISDTKEDAKQSIMKVFQSRYNRTAGFKED